MRVIVPISVGGWTRLFSRWDLLAVLLILGLLVFLGEASRHLLEPLAELEKQPPSLDPRFLPEYAARTTLRMLVAMVLSLIFTFTYATLAAKSKRAERLLVPLLDILQSVPILGFISITVVFFMKLAPGRVLGAEYAAIFAIFTSQAWNMAFSFYQSLRTVPAELEEAAQNFHLSAWMKFWRLEVPFAMPQLIWNMMMSMSGSWFFVVASEAISVGNTTVTLPGVGSYIALAIEHQDLRAVGWAIATMLVVILIYDQILFRPLVAWADRFRFEQEAGVPPPRSWVFDVLRRSRVVARLTQPFAAVWRLTMRRRRPEKHGSVKRQLPLAQSRIAFQFGLVVLALCAAALWQTVHFFMAGITLRRCRHGDRARLRHPGARHRADRDCQLDLGAGRRLDRHPAARGQHGAAGGAVPRRLSGQFAVSDCRLADCCLEARSEHLAQPADDFLGTQWYILFNVIAGAAAIPAELRAVGINLHVRGWLWWRRIALPAIFPYYVTGAITASGGSWNASIVAEVASWGHEHLQAAGLGAYIAQQTDAGDFNRVVLGIVVMSMFVVIVNRVFWRPLYFYAERKYRLG